MGPDMLTLRLGRSKFAESNPKTKHGMIAILTMMRRIFGGASKGCTHTKLTMAQTKK